MAGGAEVVIVGGGIIGLAIAREAARAGMRVVLLERGTPGCEASSAAAGILSAQLEAEASDPLLSLCLASRDLYPEFARRVASESGLDPRLMDHGTMVVARGPEAARRLERQYAFQRAAGLPADLLDRDGARRREGSLAESVEAALFLPRDTSIDNALLVRALATAAAKAGARLRDGVTASRLVVESGRVAGIEAGGERLAARAVVIAAGAWTGSIAGEGIPSLPSHPVRGQMIALASSVPRHIVVDDACYLVPRHDGRVLVGSTMERVGFDKGVTAEAVAALTSAAIALVPALGAAVFREAWAGLRPATDDGLPAIGPGPAPGLFYACGHLRNGILLAPITARLVVALLRGEAPAIDLTPFDPRRFARGPSAS